MNESEEKKLVSAVILGDDRAFERLFEIYHPIVYSVAHAIIGRRDEVDDAVQEIFMKVLGGLVHFRFNSRLSTWIYAIARNHSLNYLKRREAERSSLGKIGERIHNAGKDAEQSMIAMETRALVKEALKSINEDYRVALELRYMGEKSYEEISRIMEIPIGTVKTYIHRAKSQLKQKILEREEMERENG